MSKLVSAVFESRQDAERAVYRLQEIGIPRDAISVVARDTDPEPGQSRHAHHERDTAHPGQAGEAGKGALTGLGVGATVGALFGLAALTIPGVGPFITAGALAQVLGAAGGAAASGAIVGGATGGLAGALSRLGVSEHEARHYAGEVERGGIYVGVDLSQVSVDRPRVIDVLKRHGGRLADVPDDTHAVTGVAPDVSRAAYAADRERAPLATGASVDSGSGEVRVPLVEEVAEVRKVRREAGEVGVVKRVETETRHVSEPVIRAKLVTDTREVRADDDAPGEGRVVEIRPGETLRIRVIEEELEIRKVPRVVREVVVHAEPRIEQVEQDVELRRETVDVREIGDVEADSDDREAVRRV